MSTSAKFESRGFTLIEVLIAVAMIAILLSLAAPSFRQWVMNAQIRTAAESVTAGLQKARAEAVVRNTDVAFTLGVGSEWDITVVTTGFLVEHRPASEGSQNVTVTALASDLATDATTITYNNLGAVVPAVDSLAQIDFAAAGGTQSLRVQIGLGGNAKMCDPSLPSGSNARAC